LGLNKCDESYALGPGGLVGGVIKRECVEGRREKSTNYGKE